MDRDEFELDALVLGRDDDVNLSELVSLAIRKYAVDEPLEVVREQALAVVGRLARDGLMRVGGFAVGGAFVDETDRLSALEDEVRDAYDGSRSGMWRHTFWMQNTPAGDEVVADVPLDYDPYEEDRRLETLTELQREVLIRGLAGPVALSDVVAAAAVADRNAPIEAVRDTSLAAVRRLKGFGLIVPGVMRRDRFVSRAAELETLIGKVLESYDADPAGRWGHRLWWENTLGGDNAAESFSTMGTFVARSDQAAD